MGVSFFILCYLGSFLLQERVENTLGCHHWHGILKQLIDSNSFGFFSVQAYGQYALQGQNYTYKLSAAPEPLVAMALLQIERQGGQPRVSGFLSDNDVLCP